MTFNPYQVWYGQEGKMYATITCLALLATWFWLRRCGPRRLAAWTGYFITVSAALYTHLLMVLIIPVHFVWFLLAWPASHTRWRGYGLALAGLTLPYLPMAWWHWWLLTAPEKLSGFTFTPLAKMIEGLALNHARGFLSTGRSALADAGLFPVWRRAFLGFTEIGNAYPARCQRWRRGDALRCLLDWLLLPVASST